MFKIIIIASVVLIVAPVCWVIINLLGHYKKDSRFADPNFRSSAIRIVSWISSGILLGVLAWLVYVLERGS